MRRVIQGVCVALVQAPWWPAPGPRRQTGLVHQESAEPVIRAGRRQITPPATRCPTAIRAGTDRAPQAHGPRVTFRR